MEFESVNNHMHSSYHRLIVQGEPSVLRSKYLCELRVPYVSKEESIPSNLMLEGIADTNTTGKAAVWENFLFTTLGDIANKNPRVLNNIDESDKKSVLSTKSKIGINDYIDPTQAARVTQWQGQIDSSIDPDAIAPEAPEEPSTRRRKVAVDSDDEDEDEQLVEEPSTPKPIIPRMEEKPVTASRQKAPASIVTASDLLKADDTVIEASMVAEALPQPVYHPHSPEPVPSISFRKRVVKANTESETQYSVKDGCEGQLIDYACSSVNEEAQAVKSSAPVSLNNEFSPNSESMEDVFIPTAFISESPVSVHSKIRPARALDGACSTIPSASPEVQAASGSGLPKQPLAGLATTVSLPGKGFDPVAYGAKSRGSRGTKSSSPPSNSPTPPKKKSHSPPKTDFAPQLTKPSPMTEVGPAASNLSEEPPINMPATASAFSRTFDPNAYGGAAKASRGNHLSSRGNRVRGRGGKQQLHQPLQPSKPARSTNHRNHKPAQLVDVFEDGVDSRDTMPPPGFDIRMPMSPGLETEPVSQQHILDEPLKESRPVSRATTVPSDLISFSSGSRAPPASDDSASYINTKAYHGPNMTAIKRAQLEKLKAMKAKKSGSEDSDARISDEPPLSFHSSMSLRAGNPGKKGSQKQETKAERKKRIDKVLQEAHPNFPTLVPQKAAQDSNDMSKQKRQMLSSNYNMAVANLDSLQVESRRQATESLVTSLSPLLEASRAFKGEVRFEFQLGQLLISSDPSIKEKSIKPAKWEKLFGPAATSPILTSFTSILTTNGADIDRAAQVKSSTGGKLWHASSPEPVSVQYEFECHSKHGKSFLLVLDETRRYQLRSSNDTTIGMVGIHCPAHIWDACAVLYGIEDWRAPDEINSTIKSFLNTIYVIGDRRELVLVFRQPDDNEVMIKNVRMKRVSRYKCLAPGFQDYQLQATEIKTLYTKVHPEDKKLWQAFEKDELKMIEDAQVQYELSFINTAVNEILAQNKSLELGELVDASAGEELLRGDLIKQLVELTAHMVSRIDWMGSRNKGTLIRAAEARREQETRQYQSIHPMARSKILPVLSASRIDPSRAGAGTVYSGAVSATGSQMPAGRNIAGTRFGTSAEIYEDEHGMFARGYGGARVPIGGAGGLGAISEAPLEPDDSASQIGRAKKPVQGSVRRGVGIHEDKGPGFW